MARRYFLAYFLFTSGIVAGLSPKYALKGQEVLLTPSAFTGQPDGILWKHNGNKVVEFNGNEEHVYSPYENRITLGWVSAELNINDLRFEDSGDYELEIEINRGLHRSLYKLVVMDEVARPTISCEMNDGSSSNISGKLECSAEPTQPQSLMKFEWRSHGTVQPGPKLSIPLGEKHDDEVYSCHVSNPLSSATATFTAKECYSDKSSTVALITSIVTIAIVLLLVVLGILYYKRLHKACFAKHDLEKQSPREGSDNKKAQANESRPLLDRAPTLLSTQPLGHLVPDETPQKGQVQRMRMQFEKNIDQQTSPKKPLRGLENDTDKHNKAASPPSPTHGESPSLVLNSLASSCKGDADADQLGEPAEEKAPQCDPSDSDRANEAAAVSDDLSEDMQSDHSIASQQPEPEKEADEDEEAQSAPASAETSPASQRRSPLLESSPTTAPKDTAGEHKEDANLDQVAGETAEKITRESDSSGEEERNESDDSTEDKQLSTVPEQKGSETPLHEQGLNLSQEETCGSEDKKQETVKPVSEDGAGDCKETDELYLATSQQPQTTPQTKPDDRTPDAAYAAPGPEEEDKSSHDPEGQSAKSESETAEDKKEEKPSNESLSEDKEGQKKDEIVA